ncbi:Peptidoglycan glycosyltransferase [Coriobacterium glomerans PW2]|uniref:Peptidoglycan glycosyltransferase n=1 Tax=Coriobacterium glomerans (strain ATCC 49209 / DSM 20642 / JCM 10262 / PW2) TaxID=700015 RepID=F2N979_CORGP|nr:FtsW/RodA/SpoVE family cell cycle protein [Coriobacterium glomerans]AEB07755.1 Peptidoglycan glycosyltransferase [Coriobacterium glomerans PW2]
MSSRRNTELFLLVAAAFPVTLLYAMYVVAIGSSLSAQALAVPIGLFAAFAAAHIAVRIFAAGADPALLPIVFILSGVGITFVTRLEPSLAMNQLIYLFIAIGLMIGTLAVVKNLDMIKRYKFTLGFIGILLLVLPMFIGTEISGSKLWINIGNIASIQPGEFAKFFIVLFLAGYLAENRELLSISSHSILGFKLPRLRLLMPLFIVWAICVLIVVFERDLGSALLFYTLFLIMLYAATGRISYVIIGIVLLVIGGTGAFQVLNHVRTRFEIWMDPFADPSGSGMQIVQSLFSLADGGFVGTGIGKGLATKIPVVGSDFIFSGIGEEMGLLGGAAVLLLFMLFAVRGLTTAARAKSDLAAFSATGLTAAISFQAFLIVGGVTRLIPLTGVTLPFMSQGGTSLLASFVIIALLMRAGDEATGREAELAGSGVVKALASAPGAPNPGTTAGNARAIPSTDARPRARSRGVGSHAQPTPRMRRHLLETPESGVLGRVALAKRLTRTVVLFTALFAMLIANLTYIQVIKADEYRNMSINNHTIERTQRIKRGSIITSDGVTLAESLRQGDGTYKRTYPNGNLAAHTVGYYSQRYGATGVEKSQNRTLSGSKDYSSWENALSSLAGIAQPGNSVKLTIDSRIQKAAESALKGLKGSIVVLDPRTGAVIAKANAPTYDNTDSDSIAAVLNSGSDESKGSMFDRATQALYTPGSTFKVVTLSAALETGTATLETKFNSPSSMNIGGADVTNVNRANFGTVSLRRAFEVSSNVVYGQVAGKLGADKLVLFAKAFGFGQSLGQDFSTSASYMPKPQEMKAWELAWAGAGQPVGQGHKPGPQLTTMQNAVIAAAIANGGIAMDPYICGQILAPDGTVIKSTQPRSLGQAVSAGTADQVKSAMLDVVQRGTGREAAIKGVKVAGKTGTGETNLASKENANSTFVGFAPYDTPTVAISVVIENYYESNVTAASVAGKILAAALAVQGS